MIDLIIKNPEIVLIIFFTIEGFLIKSRGKKYSNDNPILKNDYEKASKWFLFIFNFPFIMVLFGNYFKFTNSFIDYTSGFTNNSFVNLYNILMICLILYGFNWIYFRKGAEFLEKHPGIIRIRVIFSIKEKFTANEVKFIYGLLWVGSFYMLISPLFKK